MNFHIDDPHKLIDELLRSGLPIWTYPELFKFLLQLVNEATPVDVKAILEDTLTVWSAVEFLEVRQ